MDPAIQDSLTVATFYRFVSLAEPEQWQQRLQAMSSALGLRGTVLLATEGINGTLVGPDNHLRGFVGDLLQIPEFSQMPVKYSAADGAHPVFHRLKIRVKPEIVALGLPAVRPDVRTGTHVGPQQWHQLLDDADIPVVDVRNNYETAIGQFAQAQDPQTESFKAFPQFVADNLDPKTQPKVAMYCTGGIRCEKASSYLLDLGFSEVYQLDGGILNYLAEVSDDENRWQGECFVFDQRVSVDRDLNEGAYQQCFACRHAITAQDMASAKYAQGVSCPHCFDNLSEGQRQGFAERQRQVRLAAKRGVSHIGADYSAKGGANGKN